MSLTSSDLIVFAKNFTGEDSHALAERKPLNDTAYPSTFVSWTYTGNGVWPTLPGTNPHPVTEPPEHQESEPVTVVYGQVAEYYGENPSPFGRSLVSYLTQREVLTYFKTRVRPMGELSEFLVIQEQLVANIVKSTTNVIVESTVTIADEATGSSERLQTSDAVVGQAITFNRDSTRTITESMAFTEQLSYYLVSNQWVNPGVAPPSSANEITLSWDSESLTLRNPKLGDTSAYNETQIKRNSRGNDLIVYRDPMWPTKEVLHFEFEHLSSDQALALLDFMRLSLGREIGLTDQYGRDWLGYIITPEADVVQSRRIGFDASFDFQGTLQ